MDYDGRVVGVRTPTPPPIRIEVKSNNFPRATQKALLFRLGWRPAFFLCAAKPAHQVNKTYAVRVTNRYEFQSESNIRLDVPHNGLSTYLPLMNKKINLSFRTHTPEPGAFEKQTSQPTCSA